MYLGKANNIIIAIILKKTHNFHTIIGVKTFKALNNYDENDDTFVKKRIISGTFIFAFDQFGKVSKNIVEKSTFLLLASL